MRGGGGGGRERTNGGVHLGGEEEGTKSREVSLDEI